jgi:hypothetical protein
LSVNIESIFRYLGEFDFASLLVGELRWSHPVSRRKVSIDRKHSRYEIARYENVPVFEITASDGAIPDLETRDALRKELSSLFPNCLLIFVNEQRTYSIWQWVKIENTKAYRREYIYAKGQPEDLLLDRLNTMVADLVSASLNRVSKGTSIAPSRLKDNDIYQAFTDVRCQLAEEIEGIAHKQDRDLYASILLNRLVFFYFLQRRGLIDYGNTTYLEDALKKSRNDCYYRGFLLSLFFEDLSKPAQNRNEDVQTQLWKVNDRGSRLFHPQALEQPDVQIPDRAFEQLFSFFSSYNWQIFDVPFGDGGGEAITPEKLGRIFEMQFNQASGVGLSSTPSEMLEYLCRQTIHRALVEKAQPQTPQKGQANVRTMEDILGDEQLCRRLLFEVLPSLTMLDPACGSGAFLVAALNALVMIYSEVIHNIGSLNDDVLPRRLDDADHHRGVLYYLKKTILANNLYGVDIKEDAIETTRLRLYLSLLASAQSADEIELLTDIGFHLSVGNSLARTGVNEFIEEPLAFDWVYNYPQIIKEQGGFDVIITTPPWIVIKASSRQASEQDMYQSAIWRVLPHYEYQDTIVHGKVRRTHVYLYKLFLEQSYNLLRDGGYCGIIVPHGICTDASSQRLRELLFSKTSIIGLFSFENSKKIFEGLDRRFKLDLLTFRKGNSTETFPATFDRHDVEELDRFPGEGAVNLTAEFIRRFSPDLLVIAEFKSQRDVRICEKMLRFPRLGERLAASWNVTFASGISVGYVGRSEQIERGLDVLPLFEGKMIHQFTHTFASPRLWINKQSNTRFLRQVEMQQLVGYRGYRLGVRDVAANTNERTVIATILPPNILVSNTINVISSPLDADILLFLTAIFNSFVADFYMRLRVHLHVAIHDLYQLPAPRLTRQDERFLMIVKRAARLVCTTTEFKELWEAAMREPWSSKIATTTQVERNQLRAELDGLIAHLYDITEEEFTYILRPFSLVPDPIKIAAQNAYRDVIRGLIS